MNEQEKRDYIFMMLAMNKVDLLRSLSKEYHLYDFLNNELQLVEQKLINHILSTDDKGLATFLYNKIEKKGE